MTAVQAKMLSCGPLARKNVGSPMEAKISAPYIITVCMPPKPSPAAMDADRSLKIFGPPRAMRLSVAFSLLLARGEEEEEGMKGKS